MKHLVAVYGSLLSGLGNNGVLSGNDARFLGEDITEPRFTMVSLGGFPGIVEGGNTAVKIEVYEVDDRGLSACNNLEGYHPEAPGQGFYDRIIIPTKYGDAYIYTLGESYLRGPKVEDGDWRKFLHEKAVPSWQ